MTLTTTQQSTPVKRTQRTTVTWMFSRVLTEMIWKVWQDNGAYNGTTNGPATCYEAALRVAMYSINDRRDIQPTMTVNRRTVRFSISMDLLDELNRRACEAGMDVARYAEALLVEIAPTLLAAAARNKLARELGETPRPADERAFPMQRRSAP